MKIGYFTERPYRWLPEDVIRKNHAFFAVSNSYFDREKAAALGVTFEEINNTISTNLGSAYINDFPNRGRMQRVIVQADGNARMQPDQILTYNVRNSSGQLVPMSSFAMR